MKLFVAGLPFDLDDQELQDMFTPYGTVNSAKVILDRDTRKSRGFGFVEMAEKASGEKAIDKLNNTSVNLQSIVVNEAKPRTERSDNSRNNRRY